MADHKPSSLASRIRRFSSKSTKPSGSVVEEAGHAVVIPEQEHHAAVLLTPATPNPQLVSKMSRREHTYLEQRYAPRKSCEMIGSSTQDLTSLPEPIEDHPVHRAMTPDPSLTMSSAKRRRRNLFAFGKSLDVPQSIRNWARPNSKNIPTERAQTPLRPQSSSQWLRRLRSSSVRDFNRTPSPLQSPLSQQQENGEYDCNSHTPIFNFGDLPGCEYEETKPRIDMSSGAAARAAAAAQNEILENMRKMRLSESRINSDSESGIGIERGEEGTPDDELPVVRRDPVELLPPEIMSQVLALLDADSVMNAELVSRNWYHVASSPHIWKRVFQIDFKQKSNKSHKLTAASLRDDRAMGSNVPQDWKGMWRARMALDRRWHDGHAAAIYLEGHTDSVYCVQFDEDKIVTGSRDRTVRIWSTRTYRCIKVLGVPSRTTHKLQPLPPDATNSKHRPFAKVFPSKANVSWNGDLPFIHTGSILCLQYDNEIMVTGSSDNTLIIWDIRPNLECTPMRRLEEHTAGVLDVCFDDKHIVSCSKDAAVCLWNRQTGECLRKMTGHRGPVNAVQLRGDLAVSASGDGIAKLWNLRSGLCIKEFSSRNRGMACVEFSLDSRTIFAGGNDHVIYQFDANTGELVRELKGHNDLVRSLHLDNADGRIVSGSYDSCVKAFDLASGETIVSFSKWTASWILSAKADHRRIIATSQDSRAVIMDFGYELTGIDLLEA